LPLLPTLSDQILSIAGSGRLLVCYKTQSNLSKLDQIVICQVVLAATSSVDDQAVLGAQVANDESGITLPV
jgi:hypothetical protein